MVDTTSTPAPDPGHAYALHRAGRLPEAEAEYRRLLAAAPDDPALQRHLGLVLQQQGQLEEALSCYQRALARLPASTDLVLLTGMALRDLGRLNQAAPLTARAAALAPRDAAALLLHGSVLALAGDPTAEGPLRRATVLDPQLADAWFHLGAVLHRAGRTGEAETCYRRALPLRGEDHRLLYNLALCAEALGRADEARLLLQRAVAIAPRRVDALARLAQLQAMACDWDGEAASVRALEQRLASGGTPEPDDAPEPFVLTFLPLAPAAAAAMLARYVSRVRREAAALRAPVRPPPLDGDADADRPLRIGYLSPDFGAHAVGVLVQDLFAAHDRARVEVHGYSLRRHDDATAAAIRAGCDRFHDLEAAATETIAACIAADRIDVLVDLAGYTHGARPAVLALRPAPLQIGWLGFLHSHGADWLDYLVLDAALAPPGSEAHYTEALIRLPGCALAAAPHPPVAPAPRAAFGLPEDRVLLASFNASYKLDRALFACWLRIFAEAPDADLVLSLPPAAADAIAGHWRRAGLSGSRLHLVPKLPMDGHLARMACCDLFLDAFRYQAGASAIAAAAAGLPVLACEGATPVARMGVSLNRCLGLEELVAHDADDYVARAIQLAARPERGAALKRRLQAAVRASSLLDPRRCAESLEAAYRAAWQRHLARKAPATLDL